MLSTDVPHNVRCGNEGDDFYCSVNDIMRDVSGRSSTKRRKQYMAEVKNHGIVQKDVTHKMKDTLLVACRMDRKHPVFVHTDDIDRFVVWLLHHSQKSTAAINSILLRYDIEADTFQNTMAPQTQEDAMDFLEGITRAMGLQLIREFKVGAYRIDGYVVEWKLAIEVDEHGHAGYADEKEDEREVFLQRVLGCRFLRFDPYKETMPEVMAKLIRIRTGNWDLKSPASSPSPKIAVPPPSPRSEASQPTSEED